MKLEKSATTTAGEIGGRNPSYPESEIPVNDQYLHVLGSTYAPLGGERVVPGTYDSLPQGQHAERGARDIDSAVQQTSDYEDVTRQNYENIQAA